MKAGIMQPYFFPYLGYWQLMNAVDRYVILDDVNFIKKGWINRNRILGAEGGDEMIRIQVAKISQNRTICEHQLFTPQEDFSRLLRTIRDRYRRAQNFEDFYPVLEDIFSFSGDNLADFLGVQIERIAAYLDMQTEIYRSSKLPRPEGIKGEERILNLCRQMEATEYYNAIGGTELYHRDVFAARNMELHFLKADLREYPQFKGEFVPGLSIIDVLMFNKKERVKEMLGEYSLV